MSHPPTPWEAVENHGYGWEIIATSTIPPCTLACDLTEASAKRIVACVNACKDISTEHLTQFPNWKLAVINMARPGDVANLILKLGAYREMMAKLVEQARRCNFMDENGHLLSMNTAYQAIEEVLK